MVRKKEALLPQLPFCMYDFLLQNKYTIKLKKNQQFLFRKN